ncbi:MAG: hypothetical protein JO102_05690 [Elusimicrobia bacterium]|nr:hypothetical protein [Elusimicrobiota bacterium]
MRRAPLLALAAALALAWAIPVRAEAPPFKLERVNNEDLEYIDYCGIGVSSPDDELSSDDTHDEQYLFISNFIGDKDPHSGWLKINGKIVTVTMPASEKWFPIKEHKFKHYWKGDGVEVILDCTTSYKRDKVDILTGTMTVKADGKARTLPVAGFLWAYCWNL